MRWDLPIYNIKYERKLIDVSAPMRFPSSEIYRIKGLTNWEYDNLIVKIKYSEINKRSSDV